MCLVPTNPTNPITGNPITSCAAAGNPLNILNGNKFQREEDMPALPGVLGLELVRYYNSGASRENSGKPIGGRGWRLSYDAELYIQPGTQTITLTQADGTVSNFSPNMVAGKQTTLATQWRSSSSDAGVITIQAGVISIQANPASPKEPQYKLTLPNKTTQTFQTYASYNQGNSGKLVQIKAATGETVTIQRNNAGYPEKITDPQGRYMVFNYLDAEQKKAADRYRGIQSIDTPVGRYEYTYGSDKLNAPMTLLANLVSVKLAGVKGNEVTRYYHYEDTRFPTLLTGISIKDAQSQAKGDKQLPKRLVTWGYDALGRANLSVKGEPARLELGSDGKPLEPRRLAAGTGIEQVTLEFGAKTAQVSKTNNTQVGSTGYTILTNSLGQTTRYDYTSIAGQQHITQVRGAGCVTCGASNVRYSYDGMGRQTSQTQLDNNGQPVTGVAGTQTDYDPQGRVSRISSVNYQNGKVTQVKLQARYEYIGDETVATLVASPSVIQSKEHQIRYSRNQQGQITQVTETGFSPLDTDELKRTTTYAYQSINNRSVLVAIADPLGNTTKYQWDDKANAISQVTYPLGLTASMTYDATTGRMVQTTGIDGQSTQVSYTAQGDIASWTRAGRTITTEQDMLGRTVLWKSNERQSIRASYEGAKLESKAQPIYTLSSKDAKTGARAMSDVNLDAGLKAMGAEGVMVAQIAPVLAVGAAVEWCAVTPGCVVVATGAIRICASYAKAMIQAALMGYIYETVDCAVTGTCAIAEPTADSLTAGHVAAKGDKAKPGYGGQCTPDEFDKLNNGVNNAKTKVGGFQPAACSAGMSKWELQQRHSAWLEQATARTKRDTKCFLGGDSAHQGEQATMWKHVGQCAGLLK